MNSASISLEKEATIALDRGHDLSLTKSTMKLKSTLLFVDRRDTYTLLDFISYLCEFGFINFV